MSHLNPFYTFTTYLSKVHYKIPFHLYDLSDLSSYIFNEDFVSTLLNDGNNEASTV
jgi:hypothetical protein